MASVIVVSVPVVVSVSGASVPKGSVPVASVSGASVPKASFLVANFPVASVFGAIVPKGNLETHKHMHIPTSNNFG